MFAYTHRKEYAVFAFFDFAYITIIKLIYNFKPNNICFNTY